MSVCPEATTVRTESSSAGPLTSFSLFSTLYQMVMRSEVAGLGRVEREQRGVSRMTGLRVALVVLV